MVILIFDVWRSAIQLFTVWNRQELVIYGVKPSGISYLRWETVSSWPGRARLEWFRATRALLAWLQEGILYLYQSQMLFVGNSELELALWATEFLTPHRYLRFTTVSMNFNVNYGNVT